MIIAVDFDGTIVEHRYPAIGPEKEGAIDTLKLLSREGNKLILFTVRDGELLDQAVEYCRRRGLEFFAVNSNTPQNELLPGMKPAGGKVSADVWDQIYEMITKQRAQKRRSRKKGFFDRLFGK